MPEKEVLSLEKEDRGRFLLLTCFQKQTCKLFIVIKTASRVHELSLNNTTPPVTLSIQLEKSPVL